MPYYPENRGFDVNISGNQWGLPGSYFWPYRSSAEGLYARVENFPPEEETKGLYLTNMKTNHAVRLIQEWQNEPFFLYFSYYQVHTPIEGRSDMAYHYQKKLDSGEEDFLQTNPEYAAMVEAVDRSVGRVHAKLEELGMDDNTLIIFTSDNGGLDRGDGKPTNNYPLREGKGSAYEGGIRLPMIVRWPGITPQNTVTNEPVITHDLSNEMP